MARFRLETWLFLIPRSVCKSLELVSLTSAATFFLSTTTFWSILMLLIDSPISVRKNHSQCKENLYTFSMTFGKWLVREREARGIRQPELAKRAGVSVSYISALERDEPNAKDGSPRRPRIDKVERIAKALGVTLDDALLAAGYAPRGPIRYRPKNLEEFINILESWGYEFGPGLIDKEKIKSFTEDDFEDLLERVKRDVINEVEIKARRNR